MYSLRARYYAPTQGRFTARDTAGINFKFPIELNRYVYTANHPINRFDPSGHIGEGYQLSWQQSEQHKEYVAGRGNAEGVDATNLFVESIVSAFEAHIYLAEIDLMIWRDLGHRARPRFAVGISATLELQTNFIDFALTINEASVAKWQTFAILSGRGTALNLWAEIESIVPGVIILNGDNILFPTIGMHAETILYEWNTITYARTTKDGGLAFPYRVLTVGSNFYNCVACEYALFKVYKEQVPLLFESTILFNLRAGVIRGMM